MAAIGYKRLTRERVPRQFTFTAVSASRSSLWLGDDHLLLLDRNGFTEKYKRFYFRDIQAITIRATTTRLNWNRFLVILATIIMIIGALISQLQAVGMIVTVIITGVICGIPLFFNNLFGPTCACQIRTAVQTEELPSLCRVKQVNRVLNRMRPLIAEAQGQITAEEVSAKLNGADSAEGGMPPILSS